MKVTEDFFYKESKQFYYYSRGSLFETKTWLTKAVNRGLITSEKFESFMSQINNIGVKLNNYINSIGKTSPLLNSIQLNDSNTNDSEAK